jgi:hypothetical protein
MIRHAGLIARRVAGTWRGALIEGPSGVGKSDLALRALDQGFVLVADDRTLVFVSGGCSGARPTPWPAWSRPGAWACCLSPTDRSAESTFWCAAWIGRRPSSGLPDPMFEVIEGVSTRVLDLWPLEPGAPGKIRRVFEHLGVAD